MPGLAPLLVAGVPALLSWAYLSAWSRAHRDASVRQANFLPVAAAVFGASAGVGFLTSQGLFPVVIEAPAAQALPSDLTPAVLSILLVAVIGGTSAVVDAFTSRLPLGLTVFLTAALIATGGAGAQKIGDAAQLVWSALSALTVGGVLLAGHLWRGHVGLGDVYFGIPMGWLGGVSAASWAGAFEQSIVGLGIAAGVAGVGALVRILAGNAWQSRLPFGPALWLGALAAALLPF